MKWGENWWRVKKIWAYFQIFQPMVGYRMLTISNFFLFLFKSNVCLWMHKEYSSMLSSKYCNNKKINLWCFQKNSSFQSTYYFKNLYKMILWEIWFYQSLWTITIIWDVFLFETDHFFNNECFNWRNFCKRDLSSLHIYFMPKLLLESMDFIIF